MRTFTIPGNSLFMRIFAWMWELNLEKLNICKLGWGTLFLPLALGMQVKSTRSYVVRALLYVALAGLYPTLSGAFGVALILPMSLLLFMMILLRVLYLLPEKDDAFARTRDRIRPWVVQHTPTAIKNYSCPDVIVT